MSVSVLAWVLASGVVGPPSSVGVDTGDLRPAFAIGDWRPGPALRRAAAAPGGSGVAALAIDIPDRLYQGIVVRAHGKYEGQVRMRLGLWAAGKGVRLRVYL